ncbi:uncharacterized protein LOC135377405 [Ornithodoros turicata]|uniref:uncharacterized protein LOC135377405 n=1 Tax=Ornithodoros turicata TaxID=34597 RepID=UPI0031395DCF
MRRKRKQPVCTELAPDNSSHGDAARYSSDNPRPAEMSSVDVKFDTLAKPMHNDASLLELFALIESNPCIWKNDSKNFKNIHLKRRLWRRFACHLQQRYPLMGPFTPDNLRYVYSIKRRQYYDELKEKTVRRKSGVLEYTGRWKFFDSLSFLRVHSEPFRSYVQSAVLHFEESELAVLDECADSTCLEQDSGIAVDIDVEDSPFGAPEIREGPVDCTLASYQKQRFTGERSPLATEQSPSFPDAKRPRTDTDDVWQTPKVEAVRSLTPCVPAPLYDECDQFGNIIANYMRRLSEEDRLEFHCHIMNSINDFFKCLSRYA